MNKFYNLNNLSIYLYFGIQFVPFSLQQRPPRWDRIGFGDVKGVV
jgi:hypothetical protein